MTQAMRTDPDYTYRYMKRWRHQGYRATMSALGAQRRIQALRAIGWTVPALAEATGLSTVYLYQLSSGLRSERINKRNAQAIDRAYRTLCVQPQHKTGKAKTARAWAKKQGWYPPMAWDDIDNPRERPKGTRWEKCATKGCDLLAETQGMCDTHYRSQRKAA